MTKILGLAVVVACLILAPRAMAQTVQTPDQLIDQLIQINCNAPGLYSYFPYEDFWPVVSFPLVGEGRTFPHASRGEGWAK